MIIIGNCQDGNNENQRSYNNDAYSREGYSRYERKKAEQNSPSRIGDPHAYSGPNPRHQSHNVPSNSKHPTCNYSDI